ncbi:MAG: D-aminoacyl-tRNA deacylase [Natronomonas sp.]
MLAVVVSREDEASERIGEHLLELIEWDEHEDERRSDGNGGGTYYRTGGIELRTFDDLHLYLDGAASAFDDPEMLVFVSRHSGEGGPLLTAHATGNFGPAEYGGRERSLARAAPNALSVIRDALETYAPPDYETGIECTHHGPSTVGCPSLFVELGSGKAQWRDDTGAEAVARAVLELRGVEPHTERTVVGFGGSHYAPRYDRVLTETDWGIGHIAADWGIEAMGDPEDSIAVIAKAFQASGTEFALLDGSYPELESVIDELGFETVSETFLRETTGVSLELVERVERTLDTVEEGLRFGFEAEGYDGPFDTERLPEALLEEANGIDREAVLDVVRAATIAYETAENGSLVDGSVALVDPAAYETIVSELASVLESKYETVEREDEAVIARRETFDPDLARAAGVEDGPDFGRLASGEAVEVDGDVIEPGEVRSARERRFPV